MKMIEKTGIHCARSSRSWSVLIAVVSSNAMQWPIGSSPAVA